MANKRSKNEKKNVSFRIKVDAIEMLDVLQDEYEKKLNDKIPVGLEISKAKIIELLIEEAYEDVIELSKQEEDKEKDDKQSDTK